MAFALLRPTRHDVYPFIDPRHGLKSAAKGKIVLVTGAGGGIGRAIAQAFAIAGASVVALASRRAAPLEETKRSIAEMAPDCHVVVRDNVSITDYASARSLFGPEQFPDIVVSNAAVSAEWNDVAESSLDEWRQNLDVNLTGTYHIAHAYMDAYKTLGRKEEGRIINVSSNSAWRYIPGLCSYAASKAGVNLLSEYIERENRASGLNVRCVAMHPGGVKTDLGGVKSEEIMKMLIDEPALPGGTAVYLSTARSTYLMGRFVSSTWDMEELEKHKERIEQDDDLLRERVIGVM